MAILVLISIAIAVPSHAFSGNDPGGVYVDLDDLLNQMNGTERIDVIIYKPTLAYINYTRVDFSFMAYSNISPLVMCNLSVDGNILGDKLDATYNHTITITKTLADGLHQWGMSCWSNSSSYVRKVLKALAVDSTKPVVDLVEPAKNATLQGAAVTFKIITTDNMDDTIPCILYVDNKNISTLDAVNGSIAAKQVGSLAVGNHTWKAACQDLAGNTGMSETRQFSIAEQLGAISIQILSPSQDKAFTEANVNLSFRVVNPATGNSICSIMLNGNTVKSNINAVSGATVTEEIEGLSTNVYEWNVTCTRASSFGRSQTSRFYVNILRLTSEKSTYSLGEEGSYTIYALKNTNVSITICPIGTTGWVECAPAVSYKGEYPYTTHFNFSSKAGKYSIEAVFTYPGMAKSLMAYYNVSNTFAVQIESDAIIEYGTNATFKAKQSGGIGAVNYTWNFDDGSTAKGTPVKHKYITAKNYSLILFGQDQAGNKANITKNIAVRWAYNVIVRAKDNATQVLISGARLTINGVAKTTNTSGAATYRLFYGSQEYVADATDYYASEGRFNVTGQESIVIHLLKNPVEIDPPVIKLAGPLDNEVMGADDIQLEYEVSDASSVDCKMYLKNNTDNWRYLGVKGNISTTFLVKHSLGKIRDGNYTWMVTCEDQYGNINSLKNRFIVDRNMALVASGETTTTTLNPSEDYTLAEGQITDTDISSAIASAEAAISALDSLTNEEKEVAAGLNVLQNLQAANKQLKGYSRDIFLLDSNRRGLSAKELVAERDSIINKVNLLLSQTPATMTILQKKEFVKYPSQEAVQLVSEQYLGIKKMELKGSKLNGYVDNNNVLQSLATVTTKVRVIEITYLSGETTKITLVEKDVAAKTSDKNIVFIEEIPKDLAESTDDIVFISEYAVLKKDPLVKFSLDNGSIIYYFTKDVSVPDIQKIESVLVYDIDKEMYGELTKVTGFSVSAMFSGVKFSGLGIQISIIAILILVFVSFQFDVIDKVKGISSQKDPAVENMNQLIQLSRGHLEGNRREEAAIIYGEIRLAYSELATEKRKLVYPDMMKLYNEIVLKKIDKLITEASFCIDNRLYEKAGEVYAQIQQYYQELGKEYRSEIWEKSVALYHRMQMQSI